MHAGLMHSVTRTALAVHSPEGEAASDDAWISTALLRPILHSALKCATGLFASMQSLCNSSACLHAPNVQEDLCGKTLRHEAKAKYVGSQALQYHAGVLRARRLQLYTAWRTLL